MQVIGRAFPVHPVCTETKVSSHDLVRLMHFPFSTIILPEFDFVESNFSEFCIMQALVKFKEVSFLQQYSCCSRGNYRDQIHLL